MFGIATHHDLIGLARNPHIRIARQTVPKAHVRIKLGAALIKDGWQQVGAQCHRAAIGHLLPHEHFNQRGFANPIGADKGDAVATLHQEIKRFQDRLVTEGFGNACGFDHFLAGLWTGLKPHGGGPLTFYLSCAFSP